MRQFDVIVCSKKVTVLELDKPLTTYDVRANVDGDKWLYRITKLAHQKVMPGWQERGYVHAYYHAKNNGDTVSFTRVDSVKKRKIKLRHMRQRRLFD